MNTGKQEAATGTAEATDIPLVREEFIRPREEKQVCGVFRCMYTRERHEEQRMEQDPLDGNAANTKKQTTPPLSDGRSCSRSKTREGSEIPAAFYCCIRAADHAAAGCRCCCGYATAFQQSHATEPAPHGKRGEILSLGYICHFLLLLFSPSLLKRLYSSRQQQQQQQRRRHHSLTCSLIRFRGVRTPYLRILQRCFSFSLCFLLASVLCCG